MTTKEELIQMGLSEDNATKVINEINGLKVDKERLDGALAKNKEYKEAIAEKDKAISERDKQLEGLKGSAATIEELNKKITDITKQNADNLTAYESKVRQMKIDNAIEKALEINKAKNATAVKALINSKLDLSKANVLEDGTIEGLNDVMKALKEDEATSFAFNTATTPLDNLGGFKPANNQGGANPTGKTFKDMSYPEVIEYCNKNNITVEEFIKNNN